MHTHKISCVLLLLVSTSLIGMDAAGQNDIFKAHLKNKREALLRVYEEMLTPYLESNINAYKQNKLNEIFARAESDREFTLIAAGVGSLMGAGFAIPTFQNTPSEGKYIFGSFSVLSFLFSGAAFYSWWHYKTPTMADVAKKVQAKLTKPYDGKRIMRKRLGMANCYSQPQAAQNPHNK